MTSPAHTVNNTLNKTPTAKTSSATATYNIPLSSDDVVYEIKKSRFIARIAHVADKESAKAFVEQARQDYSDARHHCWAYQLGPPHAPLSAAMSDAGEPSGTAGKPILNVLQHKDIGDIMIVVIRYFGGIKLGAGGLVRAYSHAAQLAIDNLTTTQQIAMTAITVTCDFSQEQTIRHWLKQIDSYDLNVDYRQQVSIAVSIPTDKLTAFELQCRSSGIAVHIY